MAENMKQAPQQKDVPPALKKEMEGFVGAVSKLLHGKETKSKVYEMLQSAPPDKSVPEATFQAVSRVMGAMKQGGKKPSMEAVLSGTVFATGELIEIGNAGGFFEQEIGEQNIQPVLQASIQRTIEEGVKARWIDPIELQTKMEGMLSPEQKQMGLMAGQRTGIPAQAGSAQAMEQYASQAVDRDRKRIAAKMSAKAQSGMINKAQQGGA